MNTEGVTHIVKIRKQDGAQVLSTVDVHFQIVPAHSTELIAAVVPNVVSAPVL